MLVTRRARILALTAAVAVGAACATVPAKLSGTECNALADRGNRILSSFDQAHLGCARDEDCAKVGDGACWGMCGMTVAASSVREREALQSAIKAKECEPWRAGGCATTTPPPVPSCAAWVPRCEGGKCGVGR